MPSSSSIRKQSIVLGEPFRARHRADLDLSGRGGDGQVGDRRVLGLARAGRDDRAKTVFLCQPQRIEGLGERSDLIELDQDGVAGMALDSQLQAGDLRGEQVVADQLD